MEKIKASVFFGLQRRQLFRFPQLDLSLSEDGKAVLNAFRNVAIAFLGNQKPPVSQILRKALLLLILCFRAS